MRLTTRTFASVVRRLGLELLRPLGLTASTEGKGFIVFLRPRGPTLTEGIAVYRVPKVGGFAIDIGVVPKGSRFGWALRGEGGPWREVGLRQRLDADTVDGLAEKALLNRGFVRFATETELEDGLREALSSALRSAPDIWNRLGQKLQAQ